MILYERETFLDGLFKALGYIGIPLVLVFVLFVTNGVKASKEQATRLRLAELITAVNSGDAMPADARMYSIEECSNSTAEHPNFYISGKIGAYSFRGYTAEGVDSMVFRFSGHQGGFPGYCWVELCSFALLLPTLVWELYRAIFYKGTFMEFLSELFD